MASKMTFTAMDVEMPEIRAAVQRHRLHLTDCQPHRLNPRLQIVTIEADDPAVFAAGRDAIKSIMAPTPANRHH